MTALPSSLPPLGSLLLLAAIQTVSDTDPATLAGRSARSESRERAAAREYKAARKLARAVRLLARQGETLIPCPEHTAVTSWPVPSRLEWEPDATWSVVPTLADRIAFRVSR